MDEISISKEVLPSLEGLGFSETTLGDKRGSERQYRKNNLHVREYPNRFVIHEDRVDPRANPLGHLVRDSPETLIAFGIATAFQRTQTGFSGKSPRLGSPLTFLFTFFFLNRMLGKIKRLFF